MTGQDEAASDVDKRAIGPVHVTGGSSDTAIALIIDAVIAHRSAMFAFCNAHTVNLARRDPAFAAILRQMTVFNDGIGLEIARRLIYGERFFANLNGTDLTPRLLASLPPGTRVFLLGSPPGIAQRAGAIIAERYPHVAIVGTHSGFFDPEDQQVIAEQIGASEAALVLVGMGQPRQELWAAQWTERIDTVSVCIGAFLDFTAGAVTRAPAWVQDYGLEWAYRLGQEPRRLMRRYVLGNPGFLLAMTGTAVRHRLGRKVDT